MTLLAAMRHAPTAWNAARRLQGRADIPLAPESRMALAALRLPVAFAGWRVLSSPLARCMETARALGLAPEPEPALVEMDWGAWEGETLSALRERLGTRMREAEARGLDFRPDGGESPREVQARLRPLLARLAAEGAPCLAVTHRGVLRALLAAATGWDMTGDAPRKLARHGAIHVYRLAADGTPAIERLDMALSPAGHRTA